jgi:hypothetical protein
MWALVFIIVLVLLIIASLGYIIYSYKKGKTVQAGYAVCSSNLATANVDIIKYKSQVDSLQVQLNSIQSQLNSQIIQSRTSGAGLRQAQAELSQKQAELDSVKSGLATCDTELQATNTLANQSLQVLNRAALTLFNVIEWTRTVNTQLQQVVRKYNSVMNGIQNQPTYVMDGQNQLQNYVFVSADDAKYIKYGVKNSAEECIAQCDNDDACKLWSFDSAKNCTGIGYGGVYKVAPENGAVAGIKSFQRVPAPALPPVEYPLPDPPNRNIITFMPSIDVNTGRPVVITSRNLSSFI